MKVRINEDTGDEDDEAAREAPSSKAEISKKMDKS